jgi:hypothetical protein
MCQLDAGKATLAEAELIFETVSTANQPCQLNGKSIDCVRPTQQANCRSAKKAVADAWGAPATYGIVCGAMPSPGYEQLKQQATMVVAALDASYGPNQPPPPCQGAACQDQSGGQLVVPQGPTPAPGPRLHALNLGMTVGEPQGCGVRRDDPLVISCPQNFHWDANHQRALAVYEAVGTTQTYCPSDDEHDGAEAPCLEGSPGLPPAVDVNHPPQLQQAPSVRMRRALPVIRQDGSGGG